MNQGSEDPNKTREDGYHKNTKKLCAILSDFEELYKTWVNS